MNETGKLEATSRAGGYGAEKSAEPGKIIGDKTGKRESNIVRRFRRRTQIKRGARMEEERDKETYAIIGAAMEVHKELGDGFLEAVYQEAMAHEMTLRSIPFRKEVELPVTYKGKLLNTSYRADFLCFDEVVVELKALDALTGREMSQVINYLKAGGYSRALLINFGAPILRYERIVNNFQRDAQKSGNKENE